METCKKILVLGSGALKIGEAGEFDYSGSQAIKAFKEEGKEVILVNPNIATHQTSWNNADGVYFVPVSADTVLRIIKKEQPDAIALSFGGQTALNCGLELEKRSVFKEHNITVLGTAVESIRNTEDRLAFNNILKGINVQVPKSKACESLDQALDAAKEIGFPVIVRGAFALGGKGSGQATTPEQLKDVVRIALVESPQILVEEDLTGWKEIEYEVVRDTYDNCITVCNMENIDPLGIHTGESIVVAPSQTLDNTDYQLLRNLALKVIRHFKVVGECNIQYALHPKSRQYRVIEVNARLSRSSALASKATGYPLAFIAAKLALGYSLPELKNSLTGCTTADFEPSLDYVAIKMPRWDLQKFRFVSNQVTSEMKSVGEVMAIGRNIEEALQKAIRMLNIGADGLSGIEIKEDQIKSELVRPTPRRIFAIAAAFTNGWSVDEIHVATGIDKFFLRRIEYCIQLEASCAKTNKFDIERTLIAKCKRAGISDVRLATLLEAEQDEIRTVRKAHNITPHCKQIDTLAGEFPAQTNYLYSTYNATESDVTYEADQYILVLGGGPYSIGSSVEFDWCCVQATKELQAQGYKVAMLNSNPETVSTDYDECDDLFFDELSLERVLDIVETLKPIGVVVSMGGQIPNSLALQLAANNVRILGTSAAMIDTAEDRHKFSSLLDSLDIDQPSWREFSDLESAKQFAVSVGYPVIVRPSYVLSGAAMAVVHSGEALETYLQQSALVGNDSPVVVSKFELGAKEIEFDAVAQDGKLLIYAISEHVENAGVHSGDATIVLPPQRLNLETVRRLKIISKEICGALAISGPFNIQFLAKNNRLKVIECNVRASRSFPFASKVLGENMITIATQALLGKADTTKQYQTIDLDHVGVKAAQFSFSRLKGADPQLGVEMASTGEVGCFGLNAEQALLYSLLAVGFKLPEKNILVTIGTLDDKVEIFPALKTLHKLGFAFYATKHTHDFLLSRGIESMLLHNVSEPRSPNVREYLERKRMHLVINIPTHTNENVRTDGYYMRRLAIDFGIPLFTNVQLVKRFTEAIAQENVEELPLLRWPDITHHS